MGNPASGGDAPANGAGADQQVTDEAGAVDFDEFADGGTDLFDTDGESPTWLDGGVESDHRGAFGEYGSTVDGFLDRAFRERIVLVGVTVAGRTEAETDASLDELWRDCESGDGVACDRLFEVSPVGSEYERFGLSCGERPLVLNCAEMP